MHSRGRCKTEVNNGIRYVISHLCCLLARGEESITSSVCLSAIVYDTLMPQHPQPKQAWLQRDRHSTMPVQHGHPSCHVIFLSRHVMSRHVIICSHLMSDPHSASDHLQLQCRWVAHRNSYAWLCCFMSLAMCTEIPMTTSKTTGPWRKIAAAVMQGYRQHMSSCICCMYRCLTPRSAHYTCPW